jgi:hypothetical protein
MNYRPIVVALLTLAILAAPAAAQTNGTVDLASILANQPAILPSSTVAGGVRVLYQ